MAIYRVQLEITVYSWALIHSDTELSEDQIEDVVNGTVPDGWEQIEYEDESMNPTHIHLVEVDEDFIASTL